MYNSIYMIIFSLIGVGITLGNMNITVIPLLYDIIKFYKYNYSAFIIQDIIINVAFIIGPIISTLIGINNNDIFYLNLSMSIILLIYSPICL